LEVGWLNGYFEIKATMEHTIFSVLSITALGLLVIVTGGVIYLTLADWRDRRRQDNAKRNERQK
jgi:hypothetical protein